MDPCVKLGPRNSSLELSDASFAVTLVYETQSYLATDLLFRGCARIVAFSRLVRVLDCSRLLCGLFRVATR